MKVRIDYYEPVSVDHYEPVTCNLFETVNKIRLEGIRIGKKKNNKFILNSNRLRNGRINF